MIVSVTKDDVSNIISLGNLIKDNYYTEEHIKSNLNNKIKEIIGYRIDNKLIGFIFINNLDDEIEIIDIAVSKDYQKKGIGTKLITHVINYNKPIFLEVASKNKAGLNLYKKLGFVTINIRKNYYKNDDAYVMRRNVK